MLTKNTDCKNVSNDDDKCVVQDDGWAWIVLLGAFITMIVSSIPLMCFGILYRPLLSTFEASSSAISGLFNTYSFIWNTFSITLGPLCETFGWRKVAIAGAICNSASLILAVFVSRFELLFIVFALFGGIGASVGVGTSFIVVSNYFKKRRGFAMGITTIGVCVTLFLGPPTAVLLQKEYSSKGAFLIMGAISFNAVPGAMLFRRNSSHFNTTKSGNCKQECQCNKKLLNCEKNDSGSNNLDTKKLLQNCPQYQEKKCMNENDQSIKMKWISIAKTVFLKTANNFKYLINKRIVIICVATPFLFLGYVNFQLWVPFAMVDYGYTIEFASFMLSAAGVTNALGRVCACTLADCSKIRNMTIYNIGVLCISLSILMFASFNSANTLFAAVCIWGFALGISMALYPVVIIEVVGVKTFPIAYGLASLFAGCGLLIFGPIIGFVKDSSPSFQIPLTLMSGLVLISFGAWLFMPMAQKYDANRLKLKSLRKDNHFEV